MLFDQFSEQRDADSILGVDWTLRMQEKGKLLCPFDSSFYLTYSSVVSLSLVENYHSLVV